MTIKKSQIGRPCDITLKNGTVAHGKIGNVKNGIVSIREMYIPGVHTQENGEYTSYVETKTANITIY